MAVTRGRMNKEYANKKEQGRRREEKSGIEQSWDCKRRPRPALPSHDTNVQNHGPQRPGLVFANAATPVPMTLLTSQF